MREIKKYVRYYIIIRSAWSDKNPQKPRNVVINFSYDGKRLTTNAGIKIAPCDWDSGKQRVKLTVKRAEVVNRYLDSLEEKINDIYFKAKADGVLIDTHHIVKELRKDNNTERVSFFDEWQNFLEISKCRVATLLQKIEEFIDKIAVTDKQELNIR